jgi:hypothetical protein
MANMAKAQDYSGGDIRLITTFIGFALGIILLQPFPRPFKYWKFHPEIFANER